MAQYVQSKRGGATALSLAMALAICLVGTSVSTAQDGKSTDERIKALEHERDLLKKRNGVLELRLKQLQASVNQQVTEALGPLGDERPGEPAPVPQPPGEPPVTAAPVPPLASYSYQPPYWRSIGPPFTRTAGVFSPLQQPVDLVTLSVAYQDALAASRRVRETKEAKDAARTGSADAESAESKVRLLRSITKAVRDQLADQVDRMHKLSAIHAVPTMDVRNLDTKLQILDLILAQDPEAGPVSNQSASESTVKPNKTK
jgi:hypothetical protein